MTKNITYYTITLDRIELVPGPHSNQWDPDFELSTTNINTYHYQDLQKAKQHVSDFLHDQSIKNPSLVWVDKSTKDRSIILKKSTSCKGWSQGAEYVVTIKKTVIDFMD